MRPMTVLAVLGLTLALEVPTPTQQVDSLDPSVYIEEAFVCGTDLDYRVSRGRAVAPGLEDGDGLMFEQTPPILTPDLTGTFSLRVHVVGDLASVQFDRSDPDATPSLETWPRATTRTAEGRLI